MKAIKNIGLVIFLVGLGIFTILPFIGEFQVSEATFEKFVADNGIKSELFTERIQKEVVGREFSGVASLSSKVATTLESANDQHRKNKEYGKVIYRKPHEMAANIAKVAGKGFIVENKGLMWFLTFGLGIIGALMLSLIHI